MPFPVLVTSEIRGIVVTVAPLPPLPPNMGLMPGAEAVQPMGSIRKDWLWLAIVGTVQVLESSMRRTTTSRSAARPQSPAWSPLMASEIV